MALAQINTVLGNVPANLEKHRAMIDSARGQGADLIIFPELSLTGYFLQDLTLPAAMTPRTHPVFDRLKQASREIDLMVGFVEVDSRSRFYIAAAYLSQGSILHIHRKLYLPTYTIFDEKRYFTPGSAVRSFDTRFGRAGMLICEDFWHISAPYLLWMDGADLFFFHAASPGHGLSAIGRLSSEAQVETILSSYVGLFTTPLAFTNRAGYEDGLHFPGGSMMVDSGGNLAAYAGPEEGITLAAIDTDEMRRRRFRLPLLRDERPDLVLSELERIRRRQGFGGQPDPESYEE
ncbi:MAG: nitrilase-related carbon-nitrogen hydrolase [Anaerolineaceae bacterium]